MDSMLDKQIAEYLPLLGEEEKQSLLSVIKSFLHLRQNKRISLEQYNNELAEAEADYNEKKYISHDEMKQNIKGWSKQKLK